METREGTSSLFAFSYGNYEVLIFANLTSTHMSIILKQ